MNHSAAAAAPLSLFPPLPGLLVSLLMLLSAVAVAVVVGGCESAASQPRSGLPTVTMQLGNQRFTLEVAATDESRERGLMRRDSMPADHGMIFVFTRDQPLNFYMKNTRFGLDIVFVNSAGTVVSIKQMKPYDLTITPSGAPAMWAIELNQGAAADAGLKVGDQLQIPAAARP
jgi:uncharacterized membrane protein (UPF0127 family)